MTELSDLFVPCSVCGEDTPFLQDKMCLKHLLLAIASKIKEYDHYSTQAHDQWHVESDSAMAQEALDAAIQLSRGM